jgi:hypothetical protein
MRRLIVRSAVLVALAATGLITHAAQMVDLPNRPGSVKIGIIGDNGTGAKPQYETGAMMAEVHKRFPFTDVLMLGDNMYGGQGPKDYIKKFELPYAALLSAGVTFHASLGNHDDPKQRFYPPFNMAGQRYYSFVLGDVRFVALDATNLDRVQLAWFDALMSGVREGWRIVYLHYPLYSNAGRHGSDVELRVELEPRFVKYGVQVVWAGHDHAYERIRPQKGITHFVAGSGGQLRTGDINPSPTTAAFFDTDRVFMVAEIVGADLYFQAISRLGRVVDSGVIRRE